MPSHDLDLVRLQVRLDLLEAWSHKPMQAISLDDLSEIIERIRQRITALEERPTCSCDSK